ncbi:MAG: helix-turn-helix domain-containing protein [Gemmatimonas sp.]
MIDDHRNRILNAAARVYAQHGRRGATTRRIAEEAGVNEVTIFRQFGSKHALLEIAMRESSRAQALVSLPRQPVHPENELTTWARTHYDGICGMRAMVRQMMSDACESPDAMACAKHGPSSAIAGLREYVVRLRRNGWISERESVEPAEVGAAVSMLMGALFNDAMNRDMMPELFPRQPADTLRAYVRIFLRGIGARSAPAPRALRGAKSRLSSSVPNAE